MPRDITLDLSALRHRSMGRRALSASAVRKLDPRLKKAVKDIELERAEGAHGYRDLARDHLLRRAVEDFATQARRGTDNFVVLGIGGSALGNIALQQALSHPQYNLLSRRKRGGPRLFVMDNVDPVAFAGLLDVLRDELPRTLFNVISKSGETAETASQFLVIRDLLRRRLGADEARRRIVVTTSTHGGTMRSITDREGYASLPVPDGVGGRFSALSAVGLLSAAMCGIDVQALLKGAADMGKRVESTALSRNPAAQFAAINYMCYRRGQRNVVMMPYSNSLYGLADWFRQLWAESLGKCHNARGRSCDPVGPTPIKALGATDQHSQIQLYREGPDDKLIVFLEVDRQARDVVIKPQLGDVPAMAYLGGESLGSLLAAEKRATQLALVQSRRPCITIRFPEVTAHTVGQFMLLMEAATTLAGRLFNVDPYDQPGVELGKQITYHLLGRQGFERHAARLTLIAAGPSLTAA